MLRVAIYLRCANRIRYGRVGEARRFRKFIRKSVGKLEVEHVGKIEWTFRKIKFSNFSKCFDNAGAAC